MTPRGEVANDGTAAISVVKLLVIGRVMGRKFWRSATI
jgi:hypothetical protein